MDDIEIRLRIIEIWEKMKNFYVVIIGMLFTAISFFIIYLSRSPIIIEPSVIFLFILLIILFILIILNYFIGAYKNIVTCLATLEINSSDINKLVQWRGAIDVSMIINLFFLILFLIIQNINSYQALISIQFNKSILYRLKFIILSILIINTLFIIFNLIKEMYNLRKMLKDLQEHTMEINTLVEKINKEL